MGYLLKNYQNQGISNQFSFYIPNSNIGTKRPFLFFTQWSSIGYWTLILFTSYF